MSRRIAPLALVAAVTLALAGPLPADARGFGGGGGFHGGGDFHGGGFGGGRSAPTSINRGSSGTTAAGGHYGTTAGGDHFGTTAGGTHYATNGQGGAAEAGHGSWSSANTSGYHNSGSYGTTAGGAHYATGENGAVATKNGQYATTNYNGNGYHGGNSYTNVNVDNGWNGAYGYGYHPVAYGAAVATTAAVTAAVVGSRVYALPPACSPYYATSYYYCGGVYYQPQYTGTSVTYVVVNEPPH